MMGDLERGDKCVLYYGGHIERSQHINEASAYMLLQDSGRIYDHELRVMLSLSKFPTATIIAIFDACYSAGFLGLPYTHEKDNARMKSPETPSATQMKSQVIEIASTTKFQLSFSEKYRENGEDSGTTHGILTWNLLQYLKGRWSWAFGVGL
ncbi:hypothetical protein M407DRAFT_102870 [Tulasnella calospora MUT 4182]|uniref:Peptidase C14 caspase domain-containing protein n=1 Tax=Tulasnella calospora MUT 4182 TaxID=1051891 RepID=A0A0C3QED9_9AGAM|nr:hypothetical protein M407DRAFT_102870 [Tulasnella calospora MUT 4182]